MQIRSDELRDADVEGLLGENAENTAKRLGFGLQCGELLG